MYKKLMILTLLSIFMLLSGCVKYYDNAGNLAPSSEEFDCDHKCGIYDTRMNPIGAAHCKVNCMASKGYRQ